MEGKGRLGRLVRFLSFFEKVLVRTRIFLTNPKKRKKRQKRPFCPISKKGIILQ